jgi:hypothetical protein
MSKQLFEKKITSFFRWNCWSASQSTPLNRQSCSWKCFFFFEKVSFYVFSSTRLSLSICLSFYLIHFLSVSIFLFVSLSICFTLYNLYMSFFLTPLFLPGSLSKWLFLYPCFLLSFSLSKHLSFYLGFSTHISFYPCLFIFVSLSILFTLC